MRHTTLLLALLSAALLTACRVTRRSAARAAERRLAARADTLTRRALSDSSTWRHTVWTEQAANDTRTSRDSSRIAASVRDTLIVRDTTRVTTLPDGTRLKEHTHYETALRDTRRETTRDTRSQCLQERYNAAMDSLDAMRERLESHDTKADTRSAEHTSDTSRVEITKNHSWLTKALAATGSMAILASLVLLVAPGIKRRLRGED